MNRIYLDNAATSWPKPDAVYDAVDRYQREIGANAGRGAYRSAQEAQRIINETRAGCARLLGVPDPRRVVFTSNGTSALNLAIHGLVSHGDHVATTVAEHNSVLRPLDWLARNRGVEVSYVECDGQGYVDPRDIEQALRVDTRLVAVSHASNVTGAVQPIDQIAEIVNAGGAALLVDAAQTAGCTPIDFDAGGFDLLACGSHKGLLAPLGVGLLCLRPGIEDQLPSTMQGGTGTDSFSEQQPESVPERYESGSHNLPALAGLGAAVRFLEEQSIDRLTAHCQALTRQFLEGLSEIPGVRVVGPSADQPRVGVVSCTVEGYDPQEFAAALDASCGVECRAGLQCAPRIHAALGTDAGGGVIRFSPGWATTAEEIDSALAAISALAATPAE